jgi:ribosomal protein L35AE/L33A/predicted secreted protein
LLKQPRVGTGPATLLAANVQSLAMTYGRAISDDGTRVVYSAETATNTTQVFLFDGRSGGTIRQITSLGARVTEVPLHPTISGDGSRIAFAARRTVSGAGSNSDGGVELYVYDLPTATFSKITNGPSSATADVVSSLSDDGSIVAFNYPRILSGAVTTSGTENNSEIYALAPPARPPSGALTAILNDASFGHEPSATKAVAPNSIALAGGTNLANTAAQSQRLADGTFPTNVAGTRVTVNGRAAQIFFVSPTQVSFLVPAQTEIGTAEVIVTNAENFPARLNVTTLRAAPGIFTKTGDGIGEGLILNADTLQEGPFDPTSGDLRLTIFATGARNGSQTNVSIGGRTVAAEAVLALTDMPGLDEVHVRVPTDLRGAGAVNLSVISDGRESNPVTVSFSGDPTRAILINEVLADPPSGDAGDANHDGVRDGTQDEFVELVNGSAGDTIGVSGWTIKTRATGNTTETTRFTFPSGTSVAAGEALVIFGGGTFNPTDPVFGCAQIFKATSASSGLSLTNTGLTILVRDSAGNLITQLSYGGSTGLDGNSSQSLTRSPDITGSFVLHSTPASANGRPLSPGLRLDGTPFGNCPGHLTSVTISPSSNSIAAGQNTQFTARAVDEYGRTMTGVAINFASDNTTVATVDSTSTNPPTGVTTANVTGRNQGTAHIRATATSGGVTLNSSATLNVIPKVSRIDVAPATATINRGGTQGFTASAFDQNNQPLSGVTFTWNSSNTNIATVDSAGLARGVGIGGVTITASAPDGSGGMASGTATLNVQVPLVINEINADVAPDNPATTAIEGDANRDGVRDSDDDEFVELLNNSSNAVDVSGVVVADATSNRFTFPANTTLAAGRAVVIFGGGNPPANDPAFGGALIFTTSSLSLNDTGDTVNVKLSIAGSDVIIATQTYGGSSGVAVPSDQSLTRSPDSDAGSTGGSFVAHNTATNASGRTFSPGTRVDGTPFSSPAVTRIEVLPATARANIGATQSFIAHAFNNSGGSEIEIQNVSFIWDSSDTSKATLAPTIGQTTAATALASGDTTIRARAGAQQGASVLSVNPALSINDISQSEGNSGTTTFTFTVSLSTPAPTGGVTFDIATQDGTATVANNDYVARSLTSQTIPAGSQTYSFAVTVNGDATIEPNETFFVNVTNVSGATVADGQGQGTILNDDSPVLSIADVSQNEGDSGTTTFTFTVTSSLPAPAGGITFDITTQDSTAVAPGDYTARSLTSQTIPAGQQTYNFDVTVNGDTQVELNETFLVKVTSANGNPQATGTIVNDDTANLVISQVYGGGNNSGAQFRNDFVEIFNRGTTTVDFSLTPYSVQYASVGSNFGSNKTNLTSGTIAPHRYFLVQESGGTTNGVALPSPDATGTIALASTSGKVALVAGATSLSSTACPGDDGTSPFNPLSSTIADFVGYGDTSTTAGHCYEGSAPTANLSNTTADFRKAGGCVDSNDNASDFFVAQPNPRNSASATGDCKPEIIINDVTVTEGNSGTVNATFTVSLTATSAQTVTVDFATADGTATAPADYQANSGTLTFNPGDTTKTITVLVNGDALDETNETFFVNLSNAVNGVVIDNQGQGTINDNDPAPSISINDVSVAEGESGTTPLTFTVTLSTPSGQTVTVNYATADNTATSPSDYQATSGTLTFNPGDTTKTVTVLINGDTAFEQNETFLVNLNTPVNATISDGQGQGTITNDDAAPASPTFFISDVNITEGDSGTMTANFTVTLTPASSNTVTVDFATANGTATAGSDYQSASNTLTFNPGDAPKQISVNINGDTLVEPDEAFFVNLTNATGAAIGDPQGVGTIQNDDVANLVISQIYPGGGLTNAAYTNDFIELFNRGNTTVDFSVTPYSVQFLSTSGSTWIKTDLTSGTLLPGRYFLIKEGTSGAGASLPTPDATGSTSFNITSTTAGKVALVSGTTLPNGNCPGDDGTQPFNPTNVVDFVGYAGTAATANHCYEGSGPASFTLSNNTIADFRKAGGCTDTNDNASDFFTSTPSPRNSNSPTNNCASGAAPNLSINDITVTEGNNGTVTATFTVSLSAPAQGADVSFDIATADGTATIANNDYVAKTLTNQVIPAGKTTYSFSVNINGDTAVEPDETFSVIVTNVVGANVTDGQGTGTIQNDDLPALSLTDVSLLEGDSGTRLFSFTVNLSTPAPAPVTFDIATQDGTATIADNDYVARSLTSQTIGTGVSSYTFDVTVSGDTNIEPNETFLVNVTNVSGATVTDSQGQGTIQNDDSPVLNINDVSMAEGNTGTTTFTFTVTSTLAAPAGGITFDIATADGTAQDHNAVSEDNDYVARSLTSQTIPAGQTTYTFDVTVNGDKLVEPDETFFVNVSNATNASIGDGVGQGTIQNDDIQNLVISQIYGGGNNSGATFQNDFVEIFNRGTTTVNFGNTPYSVQYASQNGSFSAGNTIGLSSGTLAPGQYFLVKLAPASPTIGAALPAADATDTGINMSATDGKVALVLGTATAGTTAGGCPSGVTVADLIGYGGANCSETTATAALSATKSALRKTDGCTDTDNNAADFTTPTLSWGTPPRNSSSAINDCNAPPNLTINDVALTEGNGGTKLFTFTVSLSKPALAGGVTFDIATANDTASAGSDYATASATGVSIGAGSQTATFDVTVNGDTTVEADETFFVNVTNVTGATVVDGQGVGTIQNDDTPALSINDVTHNEGNSSTTTYTFTVTLAPASNQTVTVNYATADSTATAGSDYTAIASTQLTFLAGETTKTFDVTVSGDTTVEPDETFVVNLSGATNANVSDSQGLGTITNDDGALVVISQIYAGGGNTGAQYTNDFVELLNRTSSTIDVSSWSIQTAAATGTSWTVTRLCPVSQICTIGPNKYYLVQLAATNTASCGNAPCGVALPTADATGTVNIAVGGNKIALVGSTTVFTGTATGTTPLAGATCPTPTNSIVDFVGFGSATCFEGGAAAPALSNTTADFRASSGCTDTNTNSSDFGAAAPNPHNSSSSHPCP